VRGQDLAPALLLGPVGDWWIAEYRPETGEAFGYASLGIPGCAEWGYIALDELERLTTGAGNVVERDLQGPPPRPVTPTSPAEGGRGRSPPWPASGRAGESRDFGHRGLAPAPDAEVRGVVAVRPTDLTSDPAFLFKVA
jgi:hypothetical protein